MPTDDRRPPMPERASQPKTGPGNGHEERPMSEGARRAFETLRRYWLRHYSAAKVSAAMRGGLRREA